jgi:hypothetical protein
MNENNYDYLKNQVKYTGFGESLDSQLKENIQKQEPEFQLKYPHTFGKENVEATLHFRKSDQSDMYFFNRYDLAITKKDDEKLQQTFYVGKENNITLKEAYNLMKGRSVHKELTNKEGENYNAWVQLDFKNTDDRGNYKLNHFHENYGFDLEKALQKHPIKELENDESKKNLFISLQKGNRQAATFLVDGQEERRYIEAKPQFKSVNVYDESGQRVGKEKKESEGQTAEKSQKNKVRQDAVGDDDGEPAKQEGKKKTHRKSKSIA